MHHWVFNSFDCHNYLGPRPSVRIAGGKLLFFSSLVDRYLVFIHIGDLEQDNRPIWNILGQFKGQSVYNIVDIVEADVIYLGNLFALVVGYAVNHVLGRDA